MDAMVDARHLRHRNLLVVVVLGYVTLGLYGIVWCRKVTVECAEARRGGGRPVWPTVIACSAFAILLASILWDALRGVPDLVRLGLAFGWQVSLALTLSQATVESRAVCRAAGSPAAGTVLHTWLTLFMGVLWLPIAMAVHQARLNGLRRSQADAAWEQAGRAPAA